MTRRTGRSTRHGRGVSLLVAAATVMAYVAVTSAPAAEVSAASIPATLPTANPANFTPNVENGEVDSIWQIGSRVIIGGTFTTVANATQNGGAVYTRNRLAAFNATTGVVDTAFAPSVNGNVNAVIPSNDPASMYIVGTFTSVGPTARQRIARVSTATGQVITTFNAGTVNGQIRDIRLVGSTLYIAGDFSTVGSSSRSRLAALNADTGAVLGSLNLPFAGVHNGGSTNVFKIDVTPDGGRLLAIGNFATVAGVNRRQIAMIDLTTNPATLAGWHTNFYTSTCASAFNTYIRDLDISEDGTFAVVTTTGAYRANTACDTISRFPVQTNAANLTPTWINYTGGDTSYAIEIHDGVAYLGGHMRWVNNPFAGDSAGAGAVPREGIAALDVVNGLPFSWNPGRARGVGVFDFHVTAAGLWAGSDTLTWAGEQRHRLAFFPFAGGIAVPPDVVGTLPNDVYTLGRLSGAGTTQDDVQRRFYTGSGAPGRDHGDPWHGAVAQHPRCLHGRLDALRRAVQWHLHAALVQRHDVRRPHDDRPVQQHDHRRPPQHHGHVLRPGRRPHLLHDEWAELAVLSRLHPRERCHRRSSFHRHRHCGFAQSDTCPRDVPERRQHLLR